MRVTQKYPCLLKFEEKHGDYNFLIKDQAECNTIALAMLKKRFDEGYWYYDISTDEIEKSLVELKKYDTDFTALPKEMQIVFAKNKIHAQDQYNQLIKSKAEFDLIKKAIENKDGVLAYKILDRRSDYEYEVMRIKYFDNETFLK